ncbi:MAG: serine/threonine-protein kinase, partial [Myxococcota bacterium]
MTGTDEVVVHEASGRRFRLLRLLGRGGFGEVHLARVESANGLDKLVAVKLLQPGIDPRSQAVQRLHDEARILASLSHPVVLAAHDLIELGGRLALVTEYVDGADLADCITGPDRMPLDTVLEVVGQVASALDAAFGALGIVHRDLKPQNIRIGIHGNVKLLDFGIARSDLLAREARTQTEVLVGSMPYVAPERFQPGSPPLPASDVFSLGCVAFEGATGARLLGGLDLPAIYALAMCRADLDRHVDQRLSAAGLPPEVDALLRQCLAYPAADRPTAGALEQAIESLLARRPDHLTVRRWCKQRARTTPVAASAPRPSADASSPVTHGSSTFAGLS